MVMQMRLAKTPTGVPSSAILIPFIKTSMFKADYSLVLTTGRVDACRELWRLIEILRAVNLGVYPEAGYVLHQIHGKKAKNLMACHVEGDMVLIFAYKVDANGVASDLVLICFGTHAKVYPKV